MRQNHGSKRSRGRNSNRRSGPSRNQTFDSNGPSVRIRGNAVQVHEKYLTLARDASSSGDRIAAENYLQHAEHYYRIVAAQREDAEARAGNNGGGQQGQGQGQGRNNGNGRRGGQNRGENDEQPTAYGTDGFEQPYGGDEEEEGIEEMPAFVKKKVAPPPAEEESDSDGDNEPESAVGD